MYEIPRDTGEKESRGLTIVLSDALECVNGAWIESIQEVGGKAECVEGDSTKCTKFYCVVCIF